MLHTMLRRAAAVSVTLGLLGAALSSAPVALAQTNCYAPATATTNPRTVVLDPGHGGTDTGASTTINGIPIYERDVVLQIGFRTRDLLQNAGYRVCMTRIDNTSNPTNTQRAQYANQQSANVLVLIHLNGSSDHTVDYTKTYWGKPSKDQAFAQVMYDALYPTLNTSPYRLGGNGVGQFADGALLKSNMPAALTESVFLTNDAEAAGLANDTRYTSDTTTITLGDRGDQIATALATGVRTWRP